MFISKFRVITTGLLAVVAAVLPTALHAEEMLYDGGEFQILLPEGFVAQPVLEVEGGSTHVFIRGFENKLASMIQITIFPPNPELEAESIEELRRACEIGLDQLFESFKRVRSNLRRSGPEEIEIDGLAGVKATWTADFEGSGLLPVLPEKGILYVIADEFGFISMRATGDENSFTTITVRAAKAIQTMNIDRSGEEPR